jgi:glycosyltransferase involved in cell wall biosynthesis
MPRTVLHLHSTFDPGGKELRCARLINAFGPAAAHTIVSAEPGALGAAKAIEWPNQASFPTDFPALAGAPLPGRLQRLARAMIGYDLVLTYNWGAMDAVMAHTLFAGVFGLPPLVHHEDGFNADEAGGLKASRNWYRRIALGRAAALVVPSERLEKIAREVWQQPPGKVVRIANGIATARFAVRPKRDALPRVVKRKGELWLGTIAGLRAVKNLPGLVRAFADLPAEWQLVILGEGPERDAIRLEAQRRCVAERLHLPGHVADPASAIGLFDLFALASESEQFPISVVEAMAAGLAVAAPDVGDVRAMLAPENAALVTPPGDEAALSAALADLAGDPAKRKRLGLANRDKARREFDESAMIEAYRRTYAAALGRESFP